MSKIKCKCGHNFSFVESPNYSMHVVRDHDFAEYTKAIYESYKISDIDYRGMLPPKDSNESKIFHENLYKALDLEGELLECPRCGRLLWRQPGKDDFSSYFMEK
jgi:uncharacterized C2H2 Zn-finger protein